MGPYAERREDRQKVRAPPRLTAQMPLRTIPCHANRSRLDRNDLERRQKDRKKQAFQWNKVAEGRGLQPLLPSFRSCPFSISGTWNDFRLFLAHRCPGLFKAQHVAPFGAHIIIRDGLESCGLGQDDGTGFHELAFWERRGAACAHRQRQHLVQGCHILRSP